MNKAEYIAHVREHYDIVSVLSKKNDCEVLRVRNRALNRDIVLRIHTSPICAYTKLKEIRHPNIVEVFDVVSLDDGEVIIEEFADGLNVADIISKEKYSYRAAKKVLLQICEALKTLHGLGIVHRDIKPENIIITSNGKAKLLDFNASRIYTPQKQKDTVILGTIGYASPEQYGISQSDEKSDIYSIGVMLNVMLTGKHPSERLAKGKAGKIILKCTQIDPKSRFQSVEKLIEAL